MEQVGEESEDDFELMCQLPDHDLTLVRGQRCARKKKTSPTAISPPELNQKADWFMNSCYFTLYIVYILYIGR